MKNCLTAFKMLVAAGLCGVSLIPTQADAQIIGDVVTASNTFENPDFTGSNQTIFGLDSAPVVEPGVEFDALVGLYEVEVTEDSLTMTLVSNEGLSFLEYAAGTFDRYYYGFDANNIDSVSVSSGDTQLTTGLSVELLEPGFVLDVADLFATGIPVPIEYPNGGFVVQFGEGTNLETLGVSATVGFTSSPVPEPAAGLMAVFGLGCLSFLRRRRR